MLILTRQVILLGESVYSSFVFVFGLCKNTRRYSHWCILNATDWSIYLLSARFFPKQDSCYLQLFSPSGVRKLNQELFPSLFLLQSLQQDVETQKAVVKHLEKRVQQTELDSQEKVQIVYYVVTKKNETAIKFPNPLTCFVCLCGRFPDCDCNTRKKWKAWCPPRSERLVSNILLPLTRLIILLFKS